MKGLTLTSWKIASAFSGYKLIATAAVITLLTIAGCAVTSSDNNGIKLYAMNCGTTDISDMTDFSRTGKFDGQPYHLVVPCFLIRHPKGDLIWDTGHPQSVADAPSGVTFSHYHQQLKTSLPAQLAQLGLKPADIEYLSLSHYHPDHSGRTHLFAQSTFIVNKTEHAIIFSDGMKAESVYPTLFAPLENSKTVLFDKEHDIFGDGTVVTKLMPGHSPGHSVLQLKLNNAGTVLLTGDLYTHAKGRELRAIASFVPDPKVLADSMDQFEALAKKQQARVIIQHEPADFAALPKFPAFLE